MLNPLYIKATSLSDAWFQTLYKCVEQGRSFTINRGSFEGQKRLEFDYINIRITHPWSIPLLPISETQMWSSRQIVLPFPWATFTGAS